MNGALMVSGCDLEKTFSSDEMLCEAETNKPFSKRQPKECRVISTNIDKTSILKTTKIASETLLQTMLSYLKLCYFTKCLNDAAQPASETAIAKYFFFKIKIFGHYTHKPAQGFSWIEKLEGAASDSRPNNVR